MRWIREIPRRLKTQEMCEEAVWTKPSSLAFVPDRFKTEGLCIRAARRDPYALDCVPDRMEDWCMSEDKKRLWFLIPDNQVVVVIR